MSRNVNDRVRKMDRTYLPAYPYWFFLSFQTELYTTVYLYYQNQFYRSRRYSYLSAHLLMFSGEIKFSRK